MLDPMASFEYVGIMEKKRAIDALGALAHAQRLDVFRMLVHHGVEGLAAGRLAERLGLPASTLSRHLGLLERAGLLRSKRVQRNVLYAIDVEGARDLIAYLTEDCCQGRPELCGYARAGGYDDGDDLPQSPVRDLA
jgi:DNA-binding transcriptional ArsR family regulator